MLLHAREEVIARHFARWWRAQDVQMPNCDGLEATRRIRLMEMRRGATASAGGKPRAAARIVGVSAHAAEEDEAEGMRAGMDAFLVKPIRPEVLRKVLQTYFGRMAHATGGEGRRSLAGGAVVAQHKKGPKQPIGGGGK